MRKLVLGIGGASGAVYAKRLFTKLEQIKDQWDEIGVVITENGVANWELEVGDFKPHAYSFNFYQGNDFNAPFASGSAQYSTMIICPCSMGLVGRIAHGISNDLITRSADVILKERRKLIVVPRETPLSLIHLSNLKLLTQAGGIVAPATPSFYSQPKSIEDLIDTVVDRVLDLAGFDIDGFRWNE